MTAPPVDVPALAATLAGQYEIERELGRGGMGVVFLARDVRLDRPVAIKTLPVHLAGDPATRERFLREARTVARLSHPSIVPIYRADELGDFVFFVMAFVGGESLAQRVRRAGPLSPAALVPLLMDVALALGYAHANGVVHRDVKGENILLDEGGSRAMMTDFGIARVAQATPMTQTGTVLGTVSHMSPEQVAGDTIDGRSDLYSCGVVAFHALTGRFPFESDTPSAVLVAHVTKAAPGLRSVAPRVPAIVAEIVDRLLRKDPAERFPDADALVTALREAARRLPRDADAVAADGVVSETEAHAIWRRAAMLQEMTGEPTPPPEVRKGAAGRRTPATLTSGYRMDDVRGAAEEIGIAPRYVDRALAERQVGEAALPSAAVVRDAVSMHGFLNRIIGANRRIDLEATLDGELPERALEDVVDEIRRGVGEIGNVSAFGRSITFASVQPSSSTGSARRLQITVNVRHGRTHVRITEDLTPQLGGIFGGIIGGVGGGAGGAVFGSLMANGAATGGPMAVLGAVGAWFGVIGASYAGARFWFRSLSRQREDELRALGGRLATLIDDSIVTAAIGPAPGDRRRIER